VIGCLEAIDFTIDMILNAKRISKYNRTYERT